VPIPSLRTSAVTAPAVAPGGAIDTSVLQVGNPQIGALIAAHPNLKQFLERASAAGAVATQAAGASTSKVTWNIWSHSEQSLGSKSPWQDQFVFVWQKTAGDNSVIDFGKEGRQAGKLVGVYRLGDVDMDVETDKQGRSGGASKDGGFQFQVKALAVGKPGEKVELFFGTGCLDNAGKPAGGWGMGLGYSGRKHLGTIGTDIEAPIHEDDHQSFTVLRQNAHGEWEGVTSKKAPPGTPGH
jgi:hypothetical protein